MTTLHSCFTIACGLFLVSCVTPVKDLKLLSLVPEPKVTKSIGPISAEACVHKLFGVPLGRTPTLSDAIGNLSREFEMSYIQGLSFDGSHSFDIWIYGRTCLGVRGVGYK